jgi:colicin import membrane protein
LHSWMADAGGLAGELQRAAAAEATLAEEAERMRAAVEALRAHGTAAEAEAARLAKALAQAAAQGQQDAARAREQAEVRLAVALADLEAAWQQRARQDTQRALAAREAAMAEEARRREAALAEEARRREARLTARAAADAEESLRDAEVGLWIAGPQNTFRYAAFASAGKLGGSSLALPCGVRVMRRVLCFVTVNGLA